MSSVQRGCAAGQHHIVHYGTNNHLPELTHEKGRRSIIKLRYVLTCFVFWGLLIDLSLRVNLSVAMVAMVNNSAIKPNEEAGTECPVINETNSTVKYEEEGEFVWDENIQGVILGSFFYGFISTQIIGGLLVEKFGSKWIFGGGILMTSVLTLLTPFAARWSVYSLVVLRVLEGMGEGVAAPAIYALFSHWAPLQEKSSMLAIAFGGCHVGSIVTLSITALLCELYEFDGGWPLVFYVFGSFGCLWFVFWSIMATSTPEEHPWISKDEQKYIIMNRPSSGQVQKNIHWKSILKSGPVWALGITKFCSAWGFYLLLTDLPAYLKMSLHVSLRDNGVLNSLLYIAECLSMILSGIASDVIRNKGYLNSSKTRKVFECFGLIGPAICLAVIPQVGCDHATITYLLITATALHGVNGGGDVPNPVDLAPDAVGPVAAIITILGNVSGILAPLATGRLILNHNDMESWSYVFYLASGIYVFGAFVFTTFGSGDVQPWGIQQFQKPSKLEGSINSSEEDKLLPPSPPPYEI